MPDSEIGLSRAKIDEEQKSASAETESKKKFILRKGGEKRSLQEQSLSYNYSEPSAKRAAMEDETLSGDELEFPDEEPSSPMRPPSNFSVTNCSPGPANGFRTLQSGVTVSKKLVIKNFKKKESSSQNLFTSSWKTLEDSVRAIQAKMKIGHSLEQLYKVVEHMCENRLGHEVYEKLQHIVRDHVIVQRVYLNDHRDFGGEKFLSDVDRLWTDYCHQMTMIRDVFLYLDRTYILQNSSIMSIWECSLTIFREEIMENSYIQKRLVKEILNVIADERKGNQVDRNLLRSLLRMLSNLQIYTQVFESPFLAATESLLSAEGETLSRDLEASEYLRHVEQRLLGEASRVDFYLDESTRQPLLAIAEKCLIAKHVELVLQKGLDSLLEANKMDDLSLAFNLFSRVKDGQTLLRNGVVAYIKRLGKSLVMNPERDPTMVASLMQFKDKIDCIVKDCFGNQEKFQQAERDAFDYFINTRPNKPAELIAKYMDSKLRSANKEASDEELDRMMDKVITLFRFIQGKDVFEAFYKKDLAKRLLLGRSASVDAEKAMLSKLKQECGAGFTHKLEGMFKDMELSIDLASAFKQHNAHEAQLNKPSVSMDFQVNVLTLGQWPAYEPVEVTLPCQLGTCLQMYQDFYVSKHSGRKLQWQHSLGQCTLKGTFRPGCKKELQVSLYQAIVLMLFNDSLEYAYKDIASATKIEAKELKRTLISLACGKVRVLTKLPKGKEIGEDDKFTVNTDLQERLYRIKISQIQMKETEEEHKQTEEQVNQDRQYQIDAAVVRIMKTRKQLPHQQLIAELFGQLRFPVRSTDLKKRIGSLIERDYLCRDTEDANVYKYVS